jgi:hypothetical protein
MPPAFGPTLAKLAKSAKNDLAQRNWAPEMIV